MEYPFEARHFDMEQGLPQHIRIGKNDFMIDESEHYFIQSSKTVQARRKHLAIGNGRRHRKVM